MIKVWDTSKNKEIERVKKEADALMIDKIIKYEAKIEELQTDLSRTKKENNDLYNRIAELIEANEKEVKNLKWIKDHDYIFLVDENKKLHKEVEELKTDNRKLAKEIDDRIVRAREAGM